MKILLSSGSLYNLDNEDVFSIANKYEFSGIELALQSFKNFERKNIEKIKKTSQKYNIHIYILHSLPFERFLIEYLLSPNFFTKKALKMSFNLAKELGVEIMVVHPYPSLFRREKVRKNMKNLLYEFRDEKIKIAIENMPKVYLCYVSLLIHSLRTKEEFKNFVKENNFYLTLDITHCRTVDISPLDFFNLNKEKIINIHLSDYKNGLQHLPLGKGDVDFDSLFKLLKENNYDNFLTLELEPRKIASFDEILECKKFIEERIR